jgi:salicylate hydroxylase
MGNKLRIAIVGSGIGGLTLALALRQRGFEPDVYEQASELAEIGAAVALSANSTRELQRLGVLDAVTAVSIEPSELIYRDWCSGRRIAAHPVHEQLTYRRLSGGRHGTTAWIRAPSHRPDRSRWRSSAPPG